MQIIYLVIDSINFQIFKKKELFLIIKLATCANKAADQIFFASLNHLVAGPLL